MMNWAHIHLLVNDVPIPARCSQLSFDRGAQAETSASALM
jgi:hypothetical protein